MRLLSPGHDSIASVRRPRFRHGDQADGSGALLPGTRVTVVGEVSGGTTLPLDEIEYVYPVLTIRQVHVWSLPTDVCYLY